MLPAHLADNIRTQVLFYLQSTFDFREKSVEAAFERFLTDPENGLFKGPWVQLRRPFRPASKDETVPFEFDVSFHPFKHQNRSWRRLTSQGQQPRPTIVTTGTGSGKTECFLFPILDHVLRARKQGQDGIKAIILYPMNALAADQEKRFAKTIFRTPELRQAGIRVGNYTGRYDPSDPGASADSGTKAMGETHGISNHAVQQEQPPDILLTNYKMLDYLLLRPQDQPLWRFNSPFPGQTDFTQPLRYLVLDELHTYDGAQGADVACLIRRLKERLQIAPGNLCMVGTSATLDDREPARDRTAGGDERLDAAETGSDRLARFASTLFEEQILSEAVIGEDRLTVEEMIAPDPQETPLPDPAVCHPLGDEDALQYAIRQSAAWGGPVFQQELSADDADESEDLDAAIQEWSVALGNWLKQQELFRFLLTIFDRADSGHGGPLTWQGLVEQLVRDDPALKEIARFDDRSVVVASLFALVAQAKEIRSEYAFPLVPTQVQLWIRELRRLGRTVLEQPVFTWLDEPHQEFPSLPVFHCSECGESGWVGLADPSTETLIQAKGVNGFQLVDDPSQVYRAWFGYKGQRSPHLVVFSPWSDADAAGALSTVGDGVVAGTRGTGGDQQQTMGFTDWYLCPKQLVLRQEDGPCPVSNDPKRFRVKVNQETRTDERQNEVGHQGCPNCQSREGVFFIGSQSATLSSVAIDELFGSVLNNDPKLLAFTDSVQDASHRAGFFSSRTYQFTFRTALQHVIDDAGEAGIRLSDAGDALLSWWSEPRPGWRGAVREAIASLMPPDLHEYSDFVRYRNDASVQQPPKQLRAEIVQRLTWEAISEFGLMQTHGRTMEPAGSSCVAWDEGRIAATLKRLRDRIPGIDPTFADLTERQLRLWLYGFLHRGRLRGAVAHPYLDSYASNGFWGKYPFGRTLPGRETYPGGGRYKPHLMVTQSTGQHDHVLAVTRGGRVPWHLVWSRRALEVRNIEEQSLLDLIAALLVCGTESGLFVRMRQDGPKTYYAISAAAAFLTSDRVNLVCSDTGKSIVRPSAEAEYWVGGCSWEYYSSAGTYSPGDYSARQLYYQNRYRKGALRRVVASEHTGLLATEDRERLEQEFSRNEHADSANVLTCTSTLEMGIDIGDLSSTMLCSIPPNTASYLQRIGRAGRSTGTALIVSVVNQRPHDLFFFGRPAEMLRGRVDPPGCWLDASAVLVRQYLAYGFDTATSSGNLQELPASGRQLADDLSRPEGNIPRFLEWMTKEEAELRTRFLRRFQRDVAADTRDRFLSETAAELLVQRIHQATNEYSRMLRDLENSRNRLRSQLSKLDDEEKETRAEIEQELRILGGRLQSLARTTALEILTDNGLLPNYAFPERGVRFYGAIYNKHRRADQEHKPIELTRPAGVALKELAPANHFYTHSRIFDIQQIAIGNPQDPLIFTWAICGACGHMRRKEELELPESQPACPQCGHDGDSRSQLDRGQQRRFVEFSRSQSLSYMEHYESLSGDRSDERDRQHYQTVRSFDLTQEAPSGAVVDETLPFGIEYFASVVMREVNVGYQGEKGVVAFGVDQEAPEEGFRVCRDCGVVCPPSTSPDDVRHRRSCSRRRANEKRRAEKRNEQPYRWEPVYLYRELKSEAIRLLLPLADDEDIDTLTASIHLGLRLRFEGNPAHLAVSPQIMPDPATGMNRYYVVLMDAVPGGTGYLKTLFQERDGQGRDGEGVMEVLRLARNALESCVCRKLHQDPDRSETDGCYRCIRTYHLQYKSDTISRERGILLLNKLIASGEKRVASRELATIKPNSLFGSMLEKKFVDVLESFVTGRKGTWEQTVIRGNHGFRFQLPGAERLWELELQPTLGTAQGVSVKSQPDFILRTDDEKIRSIAIFTDGFQYHCHPNNRLADDFNKRRAILDSGKYYVWSVTWDDLTTETAEHVMVCDQIVLQMLQRFAAAKRAGGELVPEAKMLVGNGLTQLKAFLTVPHAAGWTQLSSFAAFFTLQSLASKRMESGHALRAALDVWRTGAAMPAVTADDDGDWVHNDRASLTQDVISYMKISDAVSNRLSQGIVVARLGDRDDEITGSDFPERWRRFLSCLNLYQFLENFRFWTSRECGVTAPEIPLEANVQVNDEWAEVLVNVLSGLRSCAEQLSRLDLPVPQVEYFNEQIDDDAFAELAWPECAPPVALLAGDQTGFARSWQNLGWKVVIPDDVQARGTEYLADLIRSGVGGK